MQNTILDISDSLPLTCSRAGTCCHGNLVRLNPWELTQLASAKEMSIEEFKKHYTIAGGSILHFNGKPNNFGKKACNLYEEGKGCSVHLSRPLACRLFPLGRQIQNETTQYIFQGKEFPCLKECPEVVDLPHLSVEEYLVGQETSSYEQAQDEYLEVMQDMADIAFSLLLDTGLAESGDQETVSTWRRLGILNTEELILQMDSEWLNLLINPELLHSDPTTFARLHNEILQQKAQEKFESLNSFEEVREAAIMIMTVAFILAHSVGADAKGLSEHWIEIAKDNGAKE